MEKIGFAYDKTDKNIYENAQGKSFGGAERPLPPEFLNRRTPDVRTSCCLLDQTQYLFRARKPQAGRVA